MTEKIASKATMRTNLVRKFVIVFQEKSYEKQGKLSLKLKKPKNVKSKLKVDDNSVTVNANLRIMSTDFSLIWIFLC